ncbi:GDSL-type esterase/lipase family protein [Pontibacter populi]|uniref:GDSL-type esterase/lipase family protein n=1 Tax=Pontibacter populi TaxID=890055 RepID=A0ABV1RQB9_9BACT
MRLFTKIILFCIVVLLPAIVWAQPKRIMCLGNSITQGNNDFASYRFELWKMLVEAGADFEFVGSHNTNFGGQSPAYGTVLQGQTFTNYNEGHWGWSADQILNGNNGQPNAGKLNDWLTNYNPDFVLMHVGTNDMFRNEPINETLDELREVVAQIRDKNPNVTILLAKLIPADPGKAGPAAANNIILFNEEIPELVQELNSAASPVMLVDQFAGFNATEGSDTWDGIHPNNSGEVKMAQRWFDAIYPLLVQPLPVTLLSFNATLTTNGKVKLTWKTASEQNNSYFEVERSTDSLHFISIGRVNGRGTTQTKSTYSLLDKMPPPGDIYYRLKQVDADGKSELSKLIHLYNGTAEDVLYVYPTITQNEDITVLTQHLKPNTPLEFTIYTANGSVASTMQTKTDAEGNYRNILNPEILDGHGLYFIKLVADGKVMQGKFIVSPAY